jgi:hypothetical protein
LKKNFQRDHSAELSRLMEDFKEQFAERTQHPENFLTMSEIERMWGELRHYTSEIYSDMIMEAMSNIDEGELIRKKKQNINKKE